MSHRKNINAKQGKNPNHGGTDHVDGKGLGLQTMWIVVGFQGYIPNSTFCVQTRSQ